AYRTFQWFDAHLLQAHGPADLLLQQEVEQPPGIAWIVLRVLQLLPAPQEPRGPNPRDGPRNRRPRLERAGAYRSSFRYVIAAIPASSCCKMCRNHPALSAYA